jgi:hypothetical protein
MVYDRNAAAAAAAAAVAASTRAASYVSGSKRSTKGNPPPAHNTSYAPSTRYLKKEPTQLSPVKKRIKENKDHYVVADAYQQLDQHQLYHDSSPPDLADSHGHHQQNHVRFQESSPQQKSITRQQQALLTKPTPEVITISDSDEEPAESEALRKSAATASASTASKRSAEATVATATTTSGTTTTFTAVKSTPQSNCPSVMPVTPTAPASVLLEYNNGSVQSTPCASRSHAASCITVGDSDEDYQRTPLKIKPEPALTATLSKKNRLLAKAQSEWMLTTLKEEQGVILDRGFEGRHHGTELRYAQPRHGSSRDHLDQQLMMQQREREIEAHALERDYTAAVRERDLVLHRGLDLCGPPIAHQSPVDYGRAVLGQVEFIQPPAAHSNQVSGQDVLNMHRAAAAAAAAAAAHQYLPSPPPTQGVAHQHHSAADLYAAAAAAAAAVSAAPATVYVTTANGYQQITLPPPPAHHGRVHPATAVLAPPHGTVAAHPLPAHMQPSAAAAAAAAALFPAAAVHQHAVAAAAYGYAPLSPGKTRYLY